MLTDVGFLSRVELHVVLQRARVSQQLLTDRALHLRGEINPLNGVNQTAVFVLLGFREEKGDPRLI